MKKKVFFLCFCLLLVFALLLSACRTQGSMFGDGSLGTGSGTTSADADRILALEHAIALLKSEQSGDRDESRKELERLEGELAALKKLLSQQTEDGQTEGDRETEGTEASPSPSPAPSDFLYVRQGSNAVLTGYLGDDEFLVLPSSIDGCTVVEIADSAFTSDTLQSVVIPNTVTTVGWFAFHGCSALLSVTVPSSVTAIGYSAFPSTLTAFTVYCPGNSFAQKYAQSYGLSYALI